MKIKKRRAGTGIGGLRGERLIIKSFKDSEDGHAFLGKQHDNNWTEYKGDLKAGTYVYVGQEWQNVKSLDCSVLANL